MTNVFIELLNVFYLNFSTYTTFVTAFSIYFFLQISSVVQDGDKAQTSFTMAAGAISSRDDNYTTEVKGK